MASPIGHALAGFAIGRLGDSRGEPPTRALWITCTVLAVAPDLDFLPGILANRPAAYHQTASHSLVAALVVGLLTAMVLFRDRSRWLRGWLFCTGAYASHLALDWVGRGGGRPPLGLTLFWPVSDAAFLSPWPLLLGIAHADSSQIGTHPWLASIVSWYNVRSVALEVALTGPLVVLTELWLRRGSRARPTAATRGL